MTSYRRAENRDPGRVMPLADARAYLLASLEYGVNPLVPRMGDTGEEIETIEIVPTEEPLSVPTPEVTPAEPVPA